MKSSNPLRWRDKLVLVLLGIPPAVLLVWDFRSHNVLPSLLLNCYVLAAVPLFMVSWQCPPLRSRWFFKAMVPILLMIGLAVYAEVEITLFLRDIEVKLPARMMFGLVSTFAVIEGWIAGRIVDATHQKHRSPSAGEKSPFR